MNLEDREFWMCVRQALLMVLDALERRLGICPRTADLRREAKACGKSPPPIQPDPKTMGIGP